MSTQAPHNNWPETRVGTAVRHIVRINPVIQHHTNCPHWLHWRHWGRVASCDRTFSATHQTHRFVSL